LAPDSTSRNLHDTHCNWSFKDVEHACVTDTFEEWISSTALVAKLVLAVLRLLQMQIVTDESDYASWLWKLLT